MPSTRAMAQIVLAVALVALAVRTAALGLFWNSLRSDPDSYRRIATNLVQRGQFSASQPGYAIRPTAFRPPLYPVFLAGCSIGGEVTSARIAVFHGLLGIATVGLTGVLARWWGLSVRWAAVAALLVACDPLLLKQSALVMTETLATFLALAALICLTRLSQVGTPWTAAQAGSVLALATLCRPTFLLWLIATAASIPLLPLPATRKAANLTVFVLFAATIFTPWVLRNYLQFGVPILGTTHGGSTLRWGNNPSYYRHLREARWGEVWDAADLRRDDALARTQPSQTGVAIPAAGGRAAEHYELRLDRQNYARALSAIRQEPQMFARACLFRLGSFWRPLPYRGYGPETALYQAGRYLVGAWYVALFACAAAGTWLLGRQLGEFPWRWGVSLTILLTGMHAIYWSDIRMRAPLAPFLCVLAAKALELSLRRWVRSSAVPAETS